MNTLIHTLPQFKPKWIHGPWHEFSLDAVEVEGPNESRMLAATSVYSKRLLFAAWVRKGEWLSQYTHVNSKEFSESICWLSDHNIDLHAVNISFWTEWCGHRTCFQTMVSRHTTTELCHRLVPLTPYHPSPTVQDATRARYALWSSLFGPFLLKQWSLWRWIVTGEFSSRPATDMSTCSRVKAQKFYHLFAPHPRGISFPPYFQW